MMFEPGCGPLYEAAQVEEMRHLEVLRFLSPEHEKRAFDAALALVLPHLKAHLATQTDICRVIA